jgi:hypothetical protein
LTAVLNFACSVSDAGGFLSLADDGGVDPVGTIVRSLASTAREHFCTSIFGSNTPGQIAHQRRISQFDYISVTLPVAESLVPLRAVALGDVNRT